MPYQLTDRVTVAGLHEQAGKGIVRLVPTEVPHYAWWNEATRSVLDEMARHIAPGYEQRVLDFGAATGILGLAASVVFGAVHVQFIESVIPLQELCEQNARLNNLPSFAVSGRWPDGRFDFAVANVGDSELVQYVRKRVPHGIGTSKDGGLIRW